MAVPASKACEGDPPAPAARPPSSPEPEAAARARRALEAANPPLPRRGSLPDRAAAAAQACARGLSPELTLLTVHQGGRPDDQALRRALTSAGLTGVVITADSFAASTGTACVYGTFTGTRAEMSIGPLTDDACRP